MGDILARIRRNVGEDHCVQSCTRDGCRVYMTGIPSPRVIADADRAFLEHGLSGKRCDFVLFFQTTKNILVIAPLELKRGADTTDVSKQLQAGAAFAERIVSKIPYVIFRPILFHGQRLHAKQRKALNQAKIRFFGADLTIKTARCGQRRNLAMALSPHVS